MASITLLALTLILLIMSFSTAENTPTVATSSMDNSSTALEAHQVTEIVPIQFTWNRYTIIATAAAAVVVVAGIAASASLLLPLITYKICYLFGACSYGLDAYVDRYVATDGFQDYADYPVYQAPSGSAGTSSNGVRRRRSLETLGPIIQTLAAAYEKYESTGVSQEAKKNSVPMATHTFFTR